MFNSTLFQEQPHYAYVPIFPKMMRKSLGPFFSALIMYCLEYNKLHDDTSHCVCKLIND